MKPRELFDHSNKETHFSFSLLFWLVALNYAMTFILSALGLDLKITNITTTSVILASIYTVSHSRFWTLILVFTSTPALLNTWIMGLVGAPWIENLHNLLFVLSQISITVFLVVSLLRAVDVSANTIYAAMTVYLLIGQSFAYIYMIVFGLDNAAFSHMDSIADTYSAHLTDFMYYSFVTLTTLGFGDIAPITNIARMITTTEAIVGQLYLTIVMARLMGIYLSKGVQKT